MDQATDAGGLPRREPFPPRLLEVTFVAGGHRPPQTVRQQLPGQARCKARVGRDSLGKPVESLDDHSVGCVPTPATWPRHPPSRHPRRPLESGRWRRNCSSAKPYGSNSAWQAAQPGFWRCFSRLSRTLTVAEPPSAPGSSPSSMGTTGGGGGGSLHRRLLAIQRPRREGDVRRSSDVTDRNPARPKKPARLSPEYSTRSNFPTPGSMGIP